MCLSLLNLELVRIGFESLRGFYHSLEVRVVLSSFTLGGVQGVRGLCCRPALPAHQEPRGLCMYMVFLSCSQSQYRYGITTVNFVGEHSVLVRARVGSAPAVKPFPFFRAQRAI